MSTFTAEAWRVVWRADYRLGLQASRPWRLVRQPWPPRGPARVLRPSADLAEVELAQQIGRRRAVKAAVRTSPRSPGVTRQRPGLSRPPQPLFREGAALEGSQHAISLADVPMTLVPASAQTHDLRRLQKARNAASETRRKASEAVIRVSCVRVRVAGGVPRHTASETLKAPKARQQRDAYWLDG
jgi:hypothetical protein